MLSAFLIHQPLKLALKDRLKGRYLPRTAWAERFVAGYGLIAIVLLGIIGFKSDPLFVVPLLLALPFLLMQIYFDARNQSRALITRIMWRGGIGQYGFRSCYPGWVDTFGSTPALVDRKQPEYPIDFIRSHPAQT